MDLKYLWWIDLLPVVEAVASGEPSNGPYSIHITISRFHKADAIAILPRLRK
jgi:hypothetical protein